MTSVLTRPERMLTRPQKSDETSGKIIGSLVIQRGHSVLRAHELGGPKPRQILEILLINVGHPVSKDCLIDLLWDGAPPKEALASLESYVSVLRRHLQPGCGKTGTLRTTTGGYVIEASTDHVDLARFDSLVREAQRVSARAAYPLLMDALSLATGPLLIDELKPAWAERERRRHAAAVTAARVHASVTAAETGRTHEATMWANQALLDDPLNEAAWTALILGLEKSGQLTEGLRSFSRYRSLLDTQLGCAPSSVLLAAHSRILMATASSYEHLSEAVSALLILHDKLMRNAAGGPARRDAPDDSAARATVRSAEQILTSFLRRACEAA
ncbi:response regulator receiver protein [Cryobacterium melibiosiphilum]|uniref:Response regulator receiver protein n=1 Tax=Cryobacterium melibiosiphilum TaxID=995039 RepID=A0A3A5MQS6_9MICO|nr:BTAD domain-containing putative transcriptional regulator [Cryobacterium melibiosiphilum]RJT91315.1 response regulator receiver protein [Cryobacterium melibiosiphilum]